MGKLSRRHGNKRHARLRDRLPRPRQVAARLWLGLARQRRALVATAIAGVAVGGTLGARAWLTTSPRFAIDRVELRGVERTPASSLSERLAVNDRPNIFLYDTGAALDRLEASPWVRRAAISRDLPDGLTVEVEERIPRALLVVGGDLYLVDTAGEPFKRATADEAVGLGLVAITGLTRDALGADAAATSALIRRVIQLDAEWAAGDRPAAGEINIDPIRGFTVVTRDQAVAVRIGAGDRVAIGARLRLFDRAWAALDGAERERVAMIHLDQSAPPRRASVAFETAQWAN
jgi:cell division protein FtsQ